MAVFLSPVAGAAAQFLDNSGNVLSGGKLYTYVSGTTTPLATFTNSTGVTSHTNPIILDSAGRISNGGEIWLADSAIYKFVLKTSTDTLIATWDALTGINSNFLNYQVQNEIQTATADQTIFTLTEVTYTPGTGTLSVFVDGVKQYDGSAYSYVETDSTTVTFTEGLHVGALVQFTTSISLTAGATTADMVAYTPAGIGAVATDIQTKLRETVSVKDFGAVGDGVTDDTAAFDAAIAYAHSIDGTTIFVPAGIYGVTDLVLNYPNIIIEGSTSQYAYEGSYGAASTLKALPGSKFAVMLGIGTTFAGNYSGLRNLVVDGNNAVEFGVCIGVGNTIMDSCTITGFDYGCVLASSGNSNIFERCSFYSNSKIGFSSVDTFDDPAVEAATPGTAPFVNGYTTTFTVRNCNIRQNGYGVFLQNSWAARFEDCVIESNTRAGLWVYKAVPAIGTDNKWNKHGMFSSVWFENNWAGYVAGQQYSNAGWKYVENVPSAVYDDIANAGYTINICGFNSSHHPDYYNFNKCIVATSAPQKCLWAAQGRFIKFYRTQLWGDFDLQTFAENYTFEECEFNSVGQIPSILAGGTDSWVVKLDEANTTKALSDYDADTFTPLVVGTTVNGVATYTRQRAFYQRFGSLVNFTIDLAWSAHTGSGNMEIIDLPFLSKNTGGANWTVSIMANGLALTAGYVPVAQIVDNTTAIKLVQTPTGGGALISIPLDTSVNELVISGTYYTN